MGEAKRKNQRACPALGKNITAAECGEGRNSKIDCPADCPHNPCAPENYVEQFGPLETKVIHKLLSLLARNLTSMEIRELLGSGEAFKCHALHVWHLQGRGLFEQWREKGLLADWKNDERFVAGCFANTRVALTEIQRIENETTVIVRDLLQPELGEMRLIDTAFAKQGKRFDTHLGWIYKVPAGWRSSGAAIEFSDMGDREILDTFNILIDHLGGPAEDRQKWLLEHMILLHEAIIEVRQERRKRMFHSSDLCEVTRVFSAPQKQMAKLVAAIRKDPRCSEDKSRGLAFNCRVLERDPNDQHIEAIIGRLTISGTRIEARAVAMKRADALRDFLQKHGGTLQQEDESIIDFSKKSEAGSRQPDLAPPALLEDVASIEVVEQRIQLGPEGEAALATQLNEGLLDRQVPALDGISPREASTRPEFRARLTRLMKGHVMRNDKIRREKGLDVDLNAELIELGLDELVQPPPPLGERARRAPSSLEPPPAQPPLQGKELMRRLMFVTENKASIERHAERLSDFLDGVEQLPEGDFSIEEAQMLHIAAKFIIFALHPSPPRRFKPDSERMMAWFDEMMDAPDKFADFKDQFQQIVNACGHPELVSNVLDLTVNAAKQVGGDVRDQNKYEFIVAVAAVAWEVSHWPWHR